MVDAGPIIAAERAGLTSDQTLDALRLAAATEDLSVSAIAYTELIHGVYRADTRARAEARLLQLREIFAVVPVEPYERGIAESAAMLRAEQEAVGNELPFADSLIAATAIFLDRPLLTKNLRDFVRIPGLIILPFTLH